MQKEVQFSLDSLKLGISDNAEPCRGLIKYF